MSTSESPSGSGVSFEQLNGLNLSRSVHSLLSTCRDLAEVNRFGGLYGTGLMLVAIYDTGKQSQRQDRYAPVELARLIDAYDGDGSGFARARRAFFEREQLAPSEKWSAAPGVSRSLYRAFEKAKTLPSWDDVLATRHLVVALLDESETATNRNAWRLLEEAGIDRASILSAFVLSLAQHGVIQERDGWAASAAAVGPPKPPPRQMPPFWADFADGKAEHDCLELEGTVSAMASLIAAPELEGNLSLGIFGNWGSGKSFFMRRLREEIEHLSAQAQAHARAGAESAAVDGSFPPPVYWENIVNVEFNAWHYADANLWASMVAHLFEELRRPRGGAKQKSALDRALDQLALTVRARAEAEYERDTRQAARAEAESKLRRAQDAVERAQKLLSDASEISSWTSVNETFKAKGSEIAQQLAKARGDSPRAQADAKSAVGSVQELYSEVRELTSTSGRAHALLLRLLRDRKGRDVVYQAAALVLVPVLGLVMLEHFKPDFTSLGTSAAALIAGFTGAITRAATWLRDGAAATMSALEPLTKFRREIDAALALAEQSREKNLAELRRDLAAKTTALEGAQQSLAQKQAEVASAAETVKDVMNGSTITRFIEERLQSKQYQKELGLTAVIRQDFERLSELIQGHNARRRKLFARANEIKQKLQDALPQGDQAQLDDIFKDLGINRIVIYIDDLDRCPPQRVVAVLQTIHLLLAFPVFVVVVGVDARWVSHSLCQQYPALLSAAKQDRPTTGAKLELVSAADYLEKIFQIPFWVPPLNSGATQRLLGQITGAWPPPLQAVADPPVTAEGDPPPRRGSPEVDRMPAPEAPPASSPAAGQREAGDGGSKLPASAPQRPRILRLSEDELTAMNQLALVIARSPRSTKRFVNSYCLLKSSLSSRDHARLKTERGIDALRAPMLLLAVITGAPRLAERLLAAPFDGDTPLLRLKSLAQTLTRNTETADTYARLREFSSTQKEHDPWARLTFDELIPWATRVAQFAFEDLVTPPELATAAHAPHHST